MPVVAVGLSYKSAPFELLESSTIPPEHAADALRALLEQEAIAESVILSTCNRVEVYASGSDGTEVAEAVRNVFVERCRVDPDVLEDGLYVHRDDAAVSHLFRVTAGLDSMILGESEILGQVRRGFRIAVAAGAASSELSPLFHHALRVGKRVRTETELSQHVASFAAAAAALVRSGVGGRRDARVVVVGTGRIAAVSARELVAAGVDGARLVVVGRSEERARSVAATLGARPAPLGRLQSELARADAAVCCTAAAGTVIDAAMVAGRTKPLVLVDLAVPRDVDPSAGDVAHVALHDLSDVQSALGGDDVPRLEAVRTAEAIVAEEADRFRRARRAAAAGPTIASLLEAAEAIRQSELARVRGRLDDEELELVDQLTRRLVANLLHAPIDAARDRGGDAAELRELFRLP